MRLHSPPFEKALRRGVKKAVRSSRELKAEYRRVKRVRRNYRMLPVMRLLFSAILAGVAVYCADQAGHVRAGLAVISLWSFAGIFLQANSLRSCLYGASDLSALLVLPLPEGTVFRWEFQKYLRQSLFSLVGLVAAFAALGALLNFSILQWLLLPVVAVASWLTVLALAALCAIHYPRIPFGWIAQIFFWSAVILFWARTLIGQNLIQLLDRYASQLNLLLPTGWPVSLFLLLNPRPNWAYLALLLPVGAVIWTLKDSYRRLRNGYVYVERTFAPGSDLVPDEDGAKSPPPGQTPEKAVRVGMTAIEEIVLTRQFFASAAWFQRGRIEQRLWHWLNPREQALAEFVFPNGFYIGRVWKTIFRNSIITLLAAFLGNYLAPAFTVWIMVLGMMFTGCHAILLIASNGTAFRMISCSGVNIPIYATLAIGFRELGNLLFKYSLVQLPLMLLHAAVMGLAFAYFYQLPLLSGLLTGLQAGALIFATRFILVMLSFSSGTNDTSKVRLRTIALVCAILGLGGLFLILGVVSLVIPKPLISWACLFAAILDAYGLFRIYGWFYHANRFDLMALPKR